MKNFDEKKFVGRRKLERRIKERRTNSAPEATCTNCGRTFYGWALKFKNEKCGCGNDLDIVLLNGIRIVRDLEEESE